MSEYGPDFFRQVSSAGDPRRRYATPLFQPTRIDHFLSRAVIYRWLVRVSSDDDNAGRVGTADKSLCLEDIELARSWQLNVGVWVRQVVTCREDTIEGSVSFIVGDRDVVVRFELQRRFSLLLSGKTLSLGKSPTHIGLGPLA